jgi:hypothetical protein
VVELRRLTIPADDDARTSPPLGLNFPKRFHHCYAMRPGCPAASAYNHYPKSEGFVDRIDYVWPNGNEIVVAGLSVLLQKSSAE